MKKLWWKFACVGLAAAMALPFLAACGGGENYDSAEERNENRALRMSSGEFDGVFSPFFATSQYDSNVIGQTQIAMLSTSPDGKEVTYGVDQPVVTLDYNETMYDRNGNVTSKGDTNGTTVYQMVLKNGIKFSDGVELTAHDVLFNLYMYLDPIYDGSSTMYSTDIQGLAAYQTQDPNATEESAAGIAEKFDNLAKNRITVIQEYVAPNDFTGDFTSKLNAYNTLRNSQGIQPYTEEDIASDIELIKTEWKKELDSTWNSIDMSSYKEYPFDTSKVWQGFFLEVGLISIKTNSITGAYEKDENGKYIINWNGFDESSDYTKDAAIDLVYTEFLNTDEYVATILSAWNTATTMRTTFSSMDRELYYAASSGTDGLRVKSISGIQILDASEFDGNAVYKSGEYEMLQITINGVDPKAKWNFAFSVAPMHYYSTPECTKAAMEDDDYSESFGVQFSSVTFMNAVKEKNSVPIGAGVYQASTMYDDVYVWEADENWVPSEKTQKSFETLSEEFKSSNIVYLLRNDNFVTTGGNEEEVYTAKIKHVQYKVISTTQMITSLQGQDVDYADPSASSDNINSVEGTKHLSRIMVETAGYGYIGINAKYVNNIYVRRALMSVMDISLVQNYYPHGLSSPLYRSFSTTSWVYDAFPEADEPLEQWSPTAYYPYTASAAGDSLYTASFKAANDYLLQGGCTKKNGEWYDKNGKKLEFTFTIAGDSAVDHPAYQTLLNASNILNANGIKVTLTNDVRALYKLASGELSVWAAAWSTTVDPDMYQVYHKDSKATSIENWGYSWIKDNAASSSAEFGNQYSIIEELSDLIDEARETIVQAERAAIYREAADLVMELAVELPIYQRSDMYVYDNTVLDASTFYASPTPYMGPISENWKISYK